MGVLVEYDTEAQATYVSLREAPVAGTVTVSELVMVDVDSSGEPVGVELVMAPSEVTAADLRAVDGLFPSLKTSLRDALLAVSTTR